MPAPEGRIGHGTVLSIGDGATPTEAFTELAQIVEVSPPVGEADDIEVTTYQTSNRARAYVAGLIEWGEVPAKVLFNNHATHTDLYTKFKAGTIHNFKVTVPLPETGTVIFTFAGYVKKWGVMTPLDDRIEGEIAIKVSDDVTKTTGS